MNLKSSHLTIHSSEISNSWILDFEFTHQAPQNGSIPTHQVLQYRNSMSSNSTIRALEIGNAKISNRTCPVFTYSRFTNARMHPHNNESILLFENSAFQQFQIQGCTDFSDSILHYAQTFTAKYASLPFPCYELFTDDANEDILLRRTRNVNCRRSTSKLTMWEMIRYLY